MKPASLRRTWENISTDGIIPRQNVFLTGLTRNHPLAVEAVDVFELRAQDVPASNLRVTVYAEEHLFGTTGMQVVFHHEVQQLPVSFSDLIHELREGYAARDELLASLALRHLPQAAVGVPYDDPRNNVRDPNLRFRHYGPFLAP